MVSMRVHGPWAEPGSLNLPDMESRCTSMARIDASGTTSLIIRHEATQRVGDDEDLNYTTNVYGPIQFDDGKGTPITAVHSWTQYKEISDMADLNWSAIGSRETTPCWTRPRSGRALRNSDQLFTLTEIVSYLQGCPAD